MTKLALGAGLAMLFLSAGPAMGGVMTAIDHFDSGGPVRLTTHQAGPTYEFMNEGSGLNTLGGNRLTELWYVAGPDTGLATHVAMTASNHFISFSNDDFMLGHMMLTYTFPDTDFTAGNTAAQVVVTYLSSDSESNTTATVWDSIGGTATMSLVNPSGPGTAVFPYSGFVGTIDFTKINKMEFEIESIVPSGDFSVDLIGFGVPEPATLVLLTLGGLGMLLRHRRK